MTKKLTRGVRNNNPLNIRIGNSWQGEAGTSQGARHAVIPTLVKILSFEKTQIKFGYLLTYSYLCGINSRIFHAWILEKLKEKL